jgi:hypothetical protein
MKERLASAVAVAALVLLAVPQAAWAQKNEALVSWEPMMASGKWFVGAAAEYSYVSGDYTVYGLNGEQHAEGDLKHQLPGLHIYAGYGDLSLLYTYRNGEGDLNFTYDPFVVGPATPVSTTSKIKVQEHEVTLRWIAYKGRYFVPYVVAGYSWTEFQETQTIRTAGVTWSTTGTAERSQTIEYSAPLVGIGAIVPLKEGIGLRLEGRGKRYSAKRSGPGFPTVEDDGVGGDASATAYFGLGGLVLQLGGRFTLYDGGEIIGETSRWSWFGNLGYTYRF